MLFSDTPNIRTYLTIILKEKKTKVKYGEAWCFMESSRYDE